MEWKVFSFITLPFSYSLMAFSVESYIEWYIFCNFHLHSRFIYMRIHIIINIIFHFYFVRPLGAIFSEEQKDTSIELAFKYAVYKINKDRNILPKTTLVYDIQYVPDSTDSFRTSKKVCKSIENGVTAIFGKCVVTSRTNGILFSFRYNYCQLQRFFSFLLSFYFSFPSINPRLQQLLFC